MEAAVGHPPPVETLHLEIVTTFYRTLSRISTKNWVMARFLKYPLKWLAQNCQKAMCPQLVTKALVSHRCWCRLLLAECCCDIQCRNMNVPPQQLMTGSRNNGPGWHHIKHPRKWKLLTTILWHNCPDPRRCSTSMISSQYGSLCRGCSCSSVAAVVKWAAATFNGSLLISSRKLYQEWEVGWRGAALLIWKLARPQIVHNELPRYK